MKNTILYTYFIFGLTFILFSFYSCTIEEIPDPNGPSFTHIEENATLADLQLVAKGIESSMRDDIGFYYEAVGILGRDFYRLTNADPRYTTDLPGANGAALDNNTFYTTRSWNARYACIRNCYLLIKGAENAIGLSDSERRGFTGYAQTIQAYQLLLNATMQYENGIRLDTSDPNNLSAFTNNYQETLEGILALLDEAATELKISTFSFELSLGFKGFDTPEMFLKFNRALAARVALYMGDKTLTRKLLTESFFDLEDDLGSGIFLSFSADGGDRLNPLFYPFDGPDNLCIQKQFLEVIDSNDFRMSKVKQRAMPLIIPGTGLTGEYDVALWFSSTDWINIIRNEELVLIYAEAQIGNDNVAAVEAINVIRRAAGLSDYSGTMDEMELLDELLTQRRLSLFGEGHRWIDMRRFNKLDELPLDREGDHIHVQFPRPWSEL